MRRGRLLRWKIAGVCAALGGEERQGVQRRHAAIVLTGHSAGGHLSLIVGMLPNGTGLDNECYGDDVRADSKFNVAAIINWFGISDVNYLIQGRT
jgi:hypothetical protein